MKWSKTLIPTLKEIPSDAECLSHRLMLRAGLIRKLSSGTYSYLPLGLRVLKKTEAIVRQEMDRAGALEVLLPAIQPADIWKESGRYDELGEDMLKFKDRHGREMVLGPTHEEVITRLVKGEVKSYRQLPLVLYQIQTKFRDETRPRFGVLRSCEFIMKDAYSFDRDKKGLARNYQKMYDAYCRIFRRSGLSYTVVRADPGIMGGEDSAEFVVLTDQVKGGIELGHVFKLGTRYSESLGAKYLDERGRQKTMIMGCYGIGINRIVAATIETSHDKDGIIWPVSLSPYEVLILKVGQDRSTKKKLAEKIYQLMEKEGIEVLLDDRDERAGIKFKDADLIGIPIQVIVGEEAERSGNVEVKLRKGGKPIPVEIGGVLKAVKKNLDKLKKEL